jgi:outer membrane protein assembly factor BamB
MTRMKSDGSVSRRPLRLWPGIAVALLLVAFKVVVVPLMGQGSPPVVFLGGLAGGLAIAVWWVLFSRAPWVERVGAMLVMAGALYVTSRWLHTSLAVAGDGMLYPVLAIPATGVAFVVWAVATRSQSNAFRRVTMVATIVVACGAWTLVRTGGVTADGRSDLRWRWTPTAEERLLALTPPEPAPPAISPDAAAEPVAVAEATVDVPPAPEVAVAVAAAAPDTARPDPVTRAEGPATSEREITQVEWPGFRGPNRDGVIRGIRIETDWTRTPPIELWRQPIGPGWSSFAVHGDLIYTQEQRGADEVVSAYRLRTGEAVWRHGDAVRFYESNGGPGPRATPALHEGGVYALGATGILNALDAATGAVLWSRDAQADSDASPPGWGFAGSPLIVDDHVIVATSGRLAGYDLATGTPRWTRTTGGGGYSSPHLAHLGGVRQIVLLSGGGITSIAPGDGATLWQQPGGSRETSIVQPAFTGDDDVLVAAGDMMGGTGIRRLTVSRAAGGWTVEERWATRGLKPNFNDFVVHGGHAYGFDGTILSCIDLETGERRWKGGRYGAGQMMLLPDSDVLLVLAEDGELALVRAAPDRHTELARFRALEGKTWNHPVLVGDLLLVRNGEEMAAFRLPVTAVR